MRVFIFRLALRLALNAVGLKRTTTPLFVGAAGYAPLAGRTNATHVAVAGKRIEVHEYSTDFREPPHSVREFGSLQAFIRAFVVERIDWACTIHMATARKDTMDKLKAGQPEEFFKARRSFQEQLVMRLDRYLGSPLFVLLSKA